MTRPGLGGFLKLRHDLLIWVSLPRLGLRSIERSRFFLRVFFGTFGGVWRSVGDLELWASGGLENLGMMSLQEQATRRSGVKQEDAFAIDEVNLFERLGLATFIKLSTEFYNRVYDDEDEWFRKIFANSTKEDAIRNQYEFFVQRMGGPPLYSQRKGHPALIGRHAPFTVNEPAAERWLQHMQAALNVVNEIDADSKKRMSDFFKHTAYFLVAGKEVMNRRNAM